MTSAPRVLFVLGEGGDSAELLRLVPELEAGCELVFVASASDQMADRWVPEGARLLRIRRPRSKDASTLRAAVDTSIASLQAALAVWRVQPLAVISSGPAIGVVVAGAAWVIGARVVFVETISRVTSLSLTGRLMRRLADRYFVQWPALVEQVPGAEYRGRLL